MVFESLLKPRIAEEKPYLVFFFGFFIAILAIALSLWIYEEYSSIISILFIVILSLPLLYNTLRYEEKKDLLLKSEEEIILQHAKAVRFIILLFIGFIFAYFLYYFFLPESILNNLFEAQTYTIAKINRATSGFEMNLFVKILLNNFRVLMLAILFSFFFGTGALFIITWNSSVIAAAMGNFSRSLLAEYLTVHGMNKLASYFSVISLSVLRYLIHGIPELTSYLIAGLAGGILSSAVIHHDLRSKKFEKILLDVSSLIVIAIILLIISAILEVFVVPLLF